MVRPYEKKTFTVVALYLIEGSKSICRQMTRCFSTFAIVLNGFTFHFIRVERMLLGVVECALDSSKSAGNALIQFIRTESENASAIYCKLPIALER